MLRDPVDISESAYDTPSKCVEYVDDDDAAEEELRRAEKESLTTPVRAT